MNPGIEFDWDEGNVGHLAEHDVSPSEFEQAMNLDPDDLHHECAAGEDRFHSVGPTAQGRLPLMAWGTTVKSANTIVACTIRSAHEIRRWR